MHTCILAHCPFHHCLQVHKQKGFQTAIIYTCITSTLGTYCAHLYTTYMHTCTPHMYTTHPFEALEPTSTADCTVRVRCATLVNKRTKRCIDRNCSLSLALLQHLPRATDHKTSQQHPCKLNADVWCTGVLVGWWAGGLVCAGSRTNLTRWDGAPSVGRCSTVMIPPRLLHGRRMPCWLHQNRGR